MIPARFEARCSSCGARIVWTRTRNGRMPVDWIPSDRGNVELRFDGHDIEARVGAVGPGKYVSHFATCPQASKHRRTGQ